MKSHGIFHIILKTKKQIADAVIATKQSVCEYKTGKSMPSLEILYLPFQYLDPSFDYLLGLSDY